jgi:hypothetical protein
MTPRAKVSVLLVAATVLGGTLLRSAITSAQGSGPSASGHGNLTVSGELRTFSFTAVTKPNGKVTGEAELKSRASGVIIHVEVNCLTVVGNQAFVGGVVRHANNPLFVDHPSVFRVIDNGEGANAPPDEMSLLVTFVTGPTEDCNGPTVQTLATRPIEAGNIQVRP